jgi:hypothetical protein
VPVASASPGSSAASASYSVTMQNNLLCVNGNCIYLGPVPSVARVSEGGRIVYGNVDNPTADGTSYVWVNGVAHSDYYSLRKPGGGRSVCVDGICSPV